MAAKTSLDSNKSITALPVSAAPSSKDVQDFFQRVYTHLKEGQLQAALDLIDKEGEAYHKNLGGNNKQPIIAFISKEGLTADQRAGKFVTILKKFQNLFPEVKPDDFDLVRNQQTALAAALSKAASGAISSTSSRKEIDPAETVKKVKAVGMQAGLSEKAVEDSLEEIVLKDGSKIWMIKTAHYNNQFLDHDQYLAWEQALIKLAACEEIVLFCEPYIRQKRYEILACNSRSTGFFRGLETEISKHRIDVINSLERLTLVKGGIIRPDNLLSSIRGVLLSCINHEQPLQIMRDAAKTSKTAAAIYKATQNAMTEKTTLGDLEILAETLFRKIPLDGWQEFLYAIAPASFPSELQKPLQNFLELHREVVKGNIEKQKAYISCYMQFVTELRKVRDPEYARIFQSERATMPRGVPTFVLFGGNHAAGFKQAVIALGTKPTEKKDQGDSKEGKK